MKTISCISEVVRQSGGSEKEAKTVAGYAGELGLSINSYGLWPCGARNT